MHMQIISTLQISMSKQYNSTAEFYTSRIWSAFLAQLKLDRLNDRGELICEHCGKPIVKKYDCIGHHIIELTDDNVNDATIALNPDNVELIHFSCHNKIHRRFDGFYQSVYLVYGSPCSGKSTWAQQNANADDLIVDIDRVWECLSMQDKYSKNDRIKSNVFGVYDTLIEQVKRRVGKWRNAYIIGGYPLASDRERLCDLLRAQPIFIDESREVCEARAVNDDWREYIGEWFEAYTE